jgi:hypothetical protein
MASHTAEDLRMAARALGEAARGIGLDPAAMGPRVLAQRTVVDEHEPEEPYLPMAARERQARAPFDVERESSIPRAA